jgi:hypothetical protein
MSADMPSELQARRLRNFVVLVFLQTTAILLVLFLILRIAAPWLVSLHSTPALWLAVLLLLLCPLILLQGAYSLWRSWRGWRIGAGQVRLASH